MIYLLLNCDEYLAARRIAALKSSLGEREMADLNTAEYSGAQANAAELLGQASMMPFLTERRLIIANAYLEQLDKRMAASKGTDSAAHAEAERLVRDLPAVPATCDLVFVEERGIDKRRGLWRGFTRARAGETRHDVPGIEQLVNDRQIVLESLATPDAQALPGWLQQHARAKRVEIDRPAVQLLATFVGPNLRQLDNELEKLAAYARGRTIHTDDVKLLVSDASEALIWNLTDALSQRNGRLAMQTLAVLRRNEANPFYLLTMIARQYRIMVKVKDAMAQNRSGSEFEIAKLVGEKPFPVKKAMQQSSKYTAADLDDVIERLLEADYAMKTGAEPDTEIDVLVAELTRRSAN